MNDFFRSAIPLSRAILIQAILLGTAPLSAQVPDEPATEASTAQQPDLSKELSNPVAGLISVPFQLNWDFGIGERDPHTIINFQPVLPISLSSGWNLIARIIMPIISQPPLTAGGETNFGLGDLTVSGFVTPARPRTVTWAAGPALGLPLTTNPSLGTGKWSIGPTALVLIQPGVWTFGALVTQLWSYAGDSERSDVSQTLLQPFAAYHAPHSITLTLNTESSANWMADDGQQWTVPLQFQLSKVLKVGRSPMSVLLGGGYFVAKPDAGANWRLRSGLTLIFPVG